MTKSILLADDSVTIQKVVELTFSEGDYRVICVSNGKAAAQKVQDDRPDILLCDVIMPEMNGYEVAAFVKKNPAYSAIPVILLTGTFEPFDEEKARQSGAETYITKPFDSRMLVEKVEELLSRKPAALPAADEGPVQIFQSRTEFTLGQEPVPASPAAPAAFEGARGEHGFLGPEHEFPYPEEVPPVESTAGKEAVVETPPPVASAGVPAETTLEPLSPGRPEVVDLGSLREQDALAESGFDAVVTPSGPKHEADVLLPPLGDEGGIAELTSEPESFQFAQDAGPAEEPATSEGKEAGPFEEEEAPRSVSGAEDWGQGSIAPEGPSTEGAVAPESETPLRKPLSALEESSSHLEVVHDMTEQQEMVSEAQATMEGQGGVRAAEESPFLPEEGVETGLAEVPVEAGAPSTGETAQEPMAAEEIAPPQAPQPPVPPGPGEIEQMVRRAVAEVHPSVAKEVAAALAPAAIAGAVQELAPSHVRQAVLDLAPEHVRQAVREAVPDAVRQAVAAAAPEATRQAAAEHVAAIAPAALQDAVREAIGQMVRDMAPEIIRQVAWEVIPELAESLIRRRIQELESESG